MVDDGGFFLIERTNWVFGEERIVRWVEIWMDGWMAVVSLSWKLKMGVF